MPQLPGRPSKQYSQVGRLSRMMRTLASRACTVKELAEEFDITPRQVKRDLSHIRSEGHPLEPSNESGERTWQLPLGYKGLPPITVSPDELLSLYLAKTHLAYLEGTPFFDDLNAVIKKVEAGLPTKTANHLERIAQCLVPLHWPVRSYGAKKDVLANLRKALRLQQRIVLSYQKPDVPKPIAYQVDPYALVLHQGGLYVTGYSHRAKAQRTFAVERIKNATLTETRFEIPASYDPTKRSRQAFGIIEEPPQEVRVQFSKDVAYQIKERRWHPTQKLTPLKSGEVLLTMHAGGLDELTSWVLAWGNQAKVLAPPALQKAVVAELTEAARQYRRSR